MLEERSRSVTFYVGIQRQNNFLHVILIDPLQKRINPQVLQSFAPHGRDFTHQCVIAASELGGPFHQQDIARIFNDAEDAAIPLWILAE